MSLSWDPLHSLFLFVLKVRESHATFQTLLKSLGSTEIWTRIAGFRVQSANHYTIEPDISHSKFFRVSTSRMSIRFVENGHLTLWSFMSLQDIPHPLWAQIDGPAKSKAASHHSPSDLHSFLEVFKFLRLKQFTLSVSGLSPNDWSLISFQSELAVLSTSYKFSWIIFSHPPDSNAPLTHPSHMV